MAIKENLVCFMDAYMGCDGYYMKPKIEEDGRNSFLLLKFHISFLRDFTHLL